MARSDNASGRVQRRGKRTGVVTASNDHSDDEEMDSIEEFFDQAATPDTARGNRQSDASGAPQRSRRRTPRQPQRSAAHLNLSLPGQDLDESQARISNDTPLSTKRTVLTSPSELSNVSTLAPSPDVEVPQRSRHSSLEEQPVELPRNMEEDAQSTGSNGDAPPAMDFPPNQDEEDDLAPPELDESESSPRLSATSPPKLDVPPAVATPKGVLSDTETEDDALPASADHDLDDDDREGPGFNMVHDPETPLSEKQRREETAKQRGRIKKKSRSSIESASTKGTKAAKSKRSKKKRQVLFSPQGVPIANRDYENVPISHYVEASPDDAIGGARRSRRARCKPLEFWKNEKIVYAPYEDVEEDMAEAIGDMPVPKDIVRALPTPYRKRKVTTKPTTASSSKDKKKKAKAATDESDEISVFNSGPLKRKYKGKLMKGDTAVVWDDRQESSNDLKLVSYASKMQSTELPLSDSRGRDESEVVGSAAQAFNIPNDETGIYVGYIVGNLNLPPEGIKDAESVGPCAQTFTVCTGQPGALEVAFSDPESPEGVFEPKSASRFLLGPGDLFRVPPGNTYRLENHSKTSPCLLTWTIIRPRVIPTNQD
eukprot:Nitzschia sp. Nitz4//scaffold119_size111653//49359//51229//NITZ4_004190-RA/size111653-processed-gene-0.34-mRNA-1//-1//CDS//3329533836//5162//frame0